MLKHNGVHFGLDIIKIWLHLKQNIVLFSVPTRMSSSFTTSLLCSFSLMTCFFGFTPVSENSVTVWVTVMVKKSGCRKSWIYRIQWMSDVRGCRRDRSVHPSQVLRVPKVSLRAVGLSVVTNRNELSITVQTTVQNMPKTVVTDEMMKSDVTGRS